MDREKDTWSYVNIWYLIVPLTYVCLFFVLPLIKMMSMSFFEFQGVGKALGAFTLKNYSRFLLDPYYWKVLALTVGLSFCSAILCTIMGYPVAYYLCRTEAKVKHILTALALLPLWVPITVRLFGMMPILKTGTLFAVEMGLVYCGLPYMIMILTGPIGNISRSVEEASYVCGAGFWTTFFKITFPLTLKGLVSGFMLVFALNTAAFVVPVMLGNGKIITMTTLIQQQATYIYDWGFASAISVIFLIVSMAITKSGTLLDRLSSVRHSHSAPISLQKSEHCEEGGEK